MPTEWINDEVDGPMPGVVRMSEAAVPFLRMNLFVLFFFGDSVVPFDSNFANQISIGRGRNGELLPCIAGVRNTL